MTSPTDVTPPPADPAADDAPPLSLRRLLRTDSAETWVIAGGDDRVGSVTLHFSPDAIEGVLLLPEGVEPESVRGILGWVTDLLQLDGAAGPGGTIHWVVSVGQIEDFWRRSPGRPPTGAENDVDNARNRVEQVLGQMFQEVGKLPDGTYAVDTGSVRVFVSVKLNDAEVLVRVFAITNVDVPVDGDLPRFLLGANGGMAIGRFSLDGRNVWFDHILTPEGLDEDALARAVAAVAGVADKFDDEIKQRFGGRTFREEGSPVEAVAQSAAGMAGGYL